MTLKYRKMLWGPLRGDGQTFQGGGLVGLRPPGFEKAAYVGCMRHLTNSFQSRPNTQMTMQPSDKLTKSTHSLHCFCHSLQSNKKHCQLSQV